MQDDEHSSVRLEIDLSKDLITKTNKYVDEPYSFEIMEKSREVQYNLWSEGDFLESTSVEQKVFLPHFIERGINKRGYYCDTLIQEFVCGTALSSLLVNGDLSKEAWFDILNKIVSVNKEVFHRESLEDDDIYNFYVPKEKRELYVEELSNRLNATIQSLSHTFSKENECFNYYSLSNNDIAEWKMFFELLIKECEKNITKDTLIYNGSCDRFVHNNLLFEHIIYDTFTDKIKFINPRSRKWDIIDKNNDFARLYLSAYAGYDALVDCKYSEVNGVINLSEKVRMNMEMCEDALDEIFEGKKTYLKLYSLFLMLEIATKDSLSIDRRVSLLKYASQLKKRFIFKAL